MIVIVQLAFTVLVAVVVAFVFSWRLTLVMFGLVPVVVFVAVLQSKAVSRYGDLTQETLEYTNVLATEAIDNVRTIAQLACEETVVETYVSHLQEPYRTAVIHSHLSGFLDGLIEAILYFAIAAAFRFGVWEMEEFFEISFKNVLV